MFVHTFVFVFAYNREARPRYAPRFLCAILGNFKMALSIALDPTHPWTTNETLQACLTLNNIYMHADNYLVDYNRLFEFLYRRTDWFSREYMSEVMHPAIKQLLVDDATRRYIMDWRLLVAEWPHTSDKDQTKIAYTRNNADGIRDRQTVTTLGRYIKRHAPSMPDNIIRDIVALATPDTMSISFERTEIIRAVQEGPKSCMQSSRWDQTDHPYNVYAPEFGWGMAIRTKADGTINGRCLVNVADPENKHFVRSYTKHETYSESDQSIEAYLFSMGYTHESSWAEGLKLARIDKGNTFLMAYIDGGTDHVNIYDNYFRIKANGDYCACNTDGVLNTDTEECDHCGSEVNENDDWQNPNGDYVCSDCLRNRYVYAISRYGDRTYILEAYVTETREGEYFDDEYLSYNEIIYLEDGTYTHTDNAICVENEWHHVDDENDTYFRLSAEYDGDEYALANNVWQCAVTGNWYHIDDDDNPQLGTETTVCEEGLATLLNDRFNSELKTQKLIDLQRECDALRAQLAQLTQESQLTVEAFA